MNKTIAGQINSMAKKDQAMRKSGKWDVEVDKKNTIKLKRIIQKYGWPDYDLVGKKASDNAWLIAQHADHDIKFQKRALRLMKEKVKDKKISKKYLAYLTDRVLMHEGKALLFGTQFRITKDMKLKARRIKDKKNLDKRRKEYGLEPFSDYNRKLRKLFKRDIKRGVFKK